MENKSQLNGIIATLRLIAGLLAIGIIVVTFFISGYEPFSEKPEALASQEVAAVSPHAPELAVGSIDPTSGLVVDEAKTYQLVMSTCGACHSTALVTQNRATRDGWKDLIVWMQETQKLWDLGENEEPILDYLAKHYAPTQKGRRANLTNIEWYELE